MIKHRRISGFTLIELLVVVAIIIVLIAIMLPSISSAREQARTAACGSNIRQLGLSMITYAQEWNGSLPTLGASDADNIRPNRPDYPAGALPKLFVLGYIERYDPNTINVGSSSPTVNPILRHKTMFCPSNLDYRAGVSVRTGYQVSYFKYCLGNSPRYPSPFHTSIDSKPISFQFDGRAALVSDTVYEPDRVGQAIGMHDQKGMNAGFGDGHVEFRKLGPVTYKDNASSFRYDYFYYNKINLAKPSEFQ